MTTVLTFKEQQTILTA